MKSVDKDKHLPPIGVMRLLNQLAIGKVDGDFFSRRAYIRRGVRLRIKGGSLNGAAFPLAARDSIC